ncbi:heavy metal-associated isoprenylated plant protein 47-like [Durio zibethinus]|uniref:Heavy metal-associated isoprenylated plant protein 47-like n=1 Tax=Durio zibethinus TaxID=66656 RepID=A0A6P5WMA5_DURZI|nr:heavy metal-associated isoprenylated plant protein 47-like [Durio zibethinus]
MQQKIIIKISMHCSKCRARALKIAAVAEGVTSVALHGPEKDKLMIQGEDIDAACLTANLRKKLCHASLETIEEVKADKKEPPKPPTPIPCCCPQPLS